MSEQDALGTIIGLLDDMRERPGAQTRYAIVDAYMRLADSERTALARAEAAEAEAAGLRARVAELEAQLAAQGWRPATDKPEDGQDGRIVLRARATASLSAPGVFSWKIDHRYVCHADVEQWQPSAPVTQEMAS